MATMESFVYSMSRFVFGLGIGLALTSVYVIVTSGPDVLTAKGGEVVRLDPIVVTISAERFDAIHAEVEPAPRTVHLFGAGPRPV